VRHGKALEWFLLNLEAGKPPTVRRWPSRIATTRTAPSHGLLAILEPKYPQLEPEPLAPKNPTVTIVEINQTLGVWRANRELYPGWLIAPSTNRDTVWRNTERWIFPILDNLKSLPLNEQVMALSELNWRLELCLMPLWDKVAETIRKVLDLVNPFPRELAREAELRPSDENLGLFGWSALRRAWIELALAVLRFSREVEDTERFHYWASILGALDLTYPGVGSRLRYERCLLALAQMDHGQARAVLDEWRGEDNDPFWDVRRAALLGEIGELREAEQLAGQALQTIRSRIRPEIEDFGMLSREGWAMKLLSALKVDFLSRADPASWDFRGRFEELSRYKCDPNPDLDLLEVKLQQPAPAEAAPADQKIDFDGIVHTSVRFSAEGLWSKLRPAFESVRLAEEAAYPPKCGVVNISKELLLKAAEWLQSHWPQRAMATLLRIADAGKLDEYFSRYRIASLGQQVVDSLYPTASNALSHALTAYGAATGPKNRQQVGSVETQIDRVDISLELLSRIVFRLPDPQLEEELSRALSFYRGPTILQHPRLSLRLA
jgi:hypothetical protein